MKLRVGMMLDFIRLGQGLVVHITDTYETQIGANPVPPAHRTILSNRYECDVLVEGTMYSMSIVIHFTIEGHDLGPRIEWRVLGQQLFSRSGLAEVLWHQARVNPIDHS